MKVYIYHIINTRTGRFYLGRTGNVKKRFATHRRELRSRTHHCYKLQKAWDISGEEAFDFKVVYTGDVSDPESTEQEALDIAFRDYPEKIYNVSVHASGGDMISGHPKKSEIIKKRKAEQRLLINSMTPEERKARWARHGNMNGIKGTTRPESVKKAISESQKGNKHRLGFKCSQETRQKMSLIASKRIGDKNPFYGRSHTEESKQKIRESKLGTTPSNIKKVVIDGIEYISVSEASRQLGVCAATICFRIKSKNPNFKGYFYA
jgi:group I intron endonuclease